MDRTLPGVASLCCESRKQNVRGAGHGDAMTNGDTQWDAADWDDCRRLSQARKRLEERVVELRGLEPLTFCMPCRRATNCAIAP